MRAKNPTEQYLSDRVSVIAEKNQDPFRFGEAMSDFMREVALAVATVQGETASPLELAKWDQHYHGKLLDFREGRPQEIRITPLAGKPEPMPAPEDIPAFVERHMTRHQMPLDIPPAPPEVESVMLTHWQIRDSRIRADLHQDVVAQMVGVVQTRMSWWENYQTDPAKRPTEAQCVRLRQVLGLPERGYPYA